MLIFQHHRNANDRRLLCDQRIARCNYPEGIEQEEEIKASGVHHVLARMLVWTGLILRSSHSVIRPLTNERIRSFAHFHTTGPSRCVGACPILEEGAAIDSKIGLTIIRWTKRDAHSSEIHALARLRFSRKYHVNHERKTLSKSANVGTETDHSSISMRFSKTQSITASLRFAIRAIRIATHVDRI